MVGLIVGFGLKSAGCDDEHTSKALENRVAALEAKVSSFEETKQEATKGLSDCLDDAEEAYWSYIKLNGRKKPGPGEVWTAPMATWDTGAKNKANAIEECKARFR